MSVIHSMQANADYYERVKPLTFEQIYKEDFKKMVRLATLILGSQLLAEEAAQDAFLQLHTHWFDLRNPQGFLRTTLSNRCKDLQRRKKVSNRHLRLIQPEVVLHPSSQYVTDALQKISFKRRTILVLRFYGDYKITEIAEMLEIPEGTVHSNLRRGIKELRKVFVA